ncbi:MAG: S8 family serine peptidase [Ruminococcus sp.]|nr:S8 family serine peptidase [Ruminococcus sp.]
MKKSRILSGIVSLAVTLNYAISGYYASAVAYVQTDTDYIDYRYVGTEHAYDPLAELETEENEQRFRESADIAGNKIAFSVIESRTKGEETRYDLSGIYQKYRLYNLNKVYETANDSYSTEGAEAYEVFYEACTYSDDVWSIVDEMLEAENIISAEPVFIWNKASVGEPVEVSADEFARETHYSLLETKTVWNSLKNSDTPGKGAVVAVIDTGVDYTHKDLAENIWVNSGEIPDNGIDDDGNGYVDDVHGINAVAGTGDPMDDHGHGTHVAGVIAMSAGNGGGVGLAYGAQIMCIKAGSADGTFASSDIARAVKYAVDNGADVINMSFGGEERSSVVEAALNDAADYAVLIASAGNDGLPTSEAYENGYKNCKDVYPAGYNNVIGVMASDNEDKLARFSNWDYITGKGCEYEMTAPGVDIYSTLPDGRYAIWSGTSMASSCVAAAAALIRSEHPQKNKYDSKYITGQLINASTSKATAEPEIVTLPAITTESVTTTSTTTATTKPAAPLGNADVDGNAGISQEDFTYMLKAIVGAETLESGKGDVNNDGKVDMYDALSVLRLCSDPDSADAIISEPTANDEKIEFDIPTVDIVEDGDITNYTFTYNTDRIFKGVSGQLKFNDRNYSGEFKEINLISSSSSDIIYEFNPNNGKFVAYSANNDMSGNLTISAYDGEEGAYSVDLRSLKFYDENGKEFKDFDLGDFTPVMTFTPDRSVVAAAGTPTSVAVYDKHVEYPRLNIIDSLTRNPEPDFVVLGVTKSDRTDISEANNGDGIIQPDETVELGISLWNKWGAASDVTVKIEAIGFDGKPNPYVEVFDSSVALGDVAASSGTEASVRVKVKDNAPNDGKMEFRITVAAKNGFVSEDTAVYASESDYSFIVQRISYLRGKIKKDITLDPSRYWIIDGEVRLNEDVTMTILPGTQVQLGSELKEGSISTEGGNLICHGTIDSPIFLISGGKSSSVYFINDATVNTSYTIFYNIGTLQMNGSCEHCKLYVDNRISTGNYIMNLKDSIVYVPVDSLGIQAASNQAEIALGAATVENCLFSTTKLNYSQSVKNSVFVWADGLCDNDIFANNNIMQNNAILNKKEYGDWGVIDYSKTEIVASNFFGANYTNVTGAADNAENNYFETSKVSLTLASPEIENIYPFMTEAYVTNEKGERIENAYPGQTLMVHVKFNRDMATDVQPDVTV